MRKHGGLKEILRTRQFPGIITDTRAAARLPLRQVDLGDGTYMDSALGRRVPLSGDRRRRWLKDHNLAEVGDCSWDSLFGTPRRPKPLKIDLRKCWDDARKTIAQGGGVKYRRVMEDRELPKTGQSQVSGEDKVLDPKDWTANKR